jgi:phage-related minor tail protein
VKSWFSFGGSAGAAASGGGGAGVAGARAKGGPVAEGLPYLVGEKGPEIFVPSTSGRIETNATLNRLARATTGGIAMSPSVDTREIEAAGVKASRTGRVLHASLDTTTKPIVDTKSLDAAIEKAGRLKAILASINGSSINIDGERGGSEGGGGRDNSGGRDSGAVLPTRGAPIVRGDRRPEAP